MSFKDDVRKFSVKVEGLHRDSLAGMVSEAHKSIQTGSPITGAPGQPVDTGNLRDSWQVNWVSAVLAEISTNAEYAESIEDGVSYAHGGTPLTLRSTVGGFHSVALTVAGLDKIRDEVNARIVGR